MTYEEFKTNYKKHHTCGIPYIPHYIAYSSDCPQCEPNSSQWGMECKKEYIKKMEDITHAKETLRN